MCGTVPSHAAEPRFSSPRAYACAYHSPQYPRPLHAAPTTHPPPSRAARRRHTLQVQDRPARQNGHRPSRNATPTTPTTSIHPITPLQAAHPQPPREAPHHPTTRPPDHPNPRPIRNVPRKPPTRQIRPHHGPKNGAPSCWAPQNTPQNCLQHILQEGGTFRPFANEAMPLADQAGTW